MRRQSLYLALLVGACITGAPFARATASPTAFDPKGSDPKAVAVVDQLEHALGMPSAWRNAHYIEFTFGSARGDTLLFGRRHCWDTWTGRYRIEGTERQSGKPYVLIFRNIDDPKSVEVWLGGEKQTADSTVAQWGERGHAMFINDTYWAFMPYKLKDPGVHLKWLGMQADSVEGKTSETVGLSFDQVGLTPKDHYIVWIDPATHLVRSWKYIDGEDPRNTVLASWSDYVKTGPLMVSTRRNRPGKTTGVVIKDPVASSQVNEKMFAGP